MSKTFQWKGDGFRAVQSTLAARGWQEGKSGVLLIKSSRLPEHVKAPWVWLVPEHVGAALLQQAVDRGALDVITLDTPKWDARLVARLEESAVAEPTLPAVKDFVAESAAAKDLLRRLHQAAQSSMPVLLTGETGTGKEVASRLVHQWSARKSRAFVAINCSAIPNELMEGELFGYVRGAFSGATRDYDGQISAAEGGTVLLDEIDDTPIVLQNKLLRVLEDRVISRLGENVWNKIDFRLIAATNRDLKGLIARGQFGADLFERLATVQVVLPPLRERLEDIPALVNVFVERFYVEDPLAAKRARVREVTSEAIELLRAYAWPGNIRELRNVIFGALVAKRAGESLLVSDLPRRLWTEKSGAMAASDDSELETRIASGRFNLKRELEAVERKALDIALRRADGNAAEAARLLGEVGRGSAKDPGGTVRTMIKRLGLRS
ncbi:MAG: sigma-54-dependent Fis family transcriptional regulator [Archangium sp.]|nr:sigma-54-dependent Fis family transcriptional regulator [Archangium sp.]